MKKILILLLIGLLGCRQEEDVRPELLFRTWTQTASGQPVPYPVVVEFRRDGTLLYGPDKRPAWCCSPATFTSTRTIVRFLWPQTPDPQCALVNCALSALTVGVDWQIKKLSTNELVLSSGGQTISFAAR
ncbi:hypothetical protein F5984_14935 [Rudanella paleaurantiibacter]|uniref:META domain-containing protein n=1 Tax=Rudanella paleaurantiibacter TaxID=2614655 RepID=A0A7J5TZ71_9BACT|nr:hypothetical protein [Rudanella paleaurantiibacter]KAB7730439.1 hypothetical protein F5984_14935 [Rudanella paleaurantiibacter]